MHIVNGDKATHRGEFYVHLDTCKRCADEPFNLCAVGASLLEKEARKLADTVPLWADCPETSTTHSL